MQTSSTFKRVTGMSPSEYRKAAMDDYPGA